jgi:hypothetical protein
MIPIVPDNTSYFRSPIENVTPCKTLSIQAVYSLIKNGSMEKLTNDLRAGLKSKNKDLPYFTPSGVFAKRAASKIASYSGIVSFDLDNVNTAFKYALISDPFLNPVMIFVSPGGKGLKIFVRIQNPAAENHLHYWQAGVKYFKFRYNLDVDPSCKDICRACYLCHDPEALFCEYGCVNAQNLLNKFPPEDSSTVPLSANSSPIRANSQNAIEIEQLKELEKLYRNFKLYNRHF